MQNYGLNEKDIRAGRQILEDERLESFEENNLYRAAIYSILSPAEKSSSLKAGYKNFFKNYNTSEDVLTASEEDIEKVLNVDRGVNGISTSKQKATRVKDFTEYWINSDLPDILKWDIKNGRTKWLGIRKKLSEAPGLGPKTSSLFLMKIGYGNVIPIDKWEMNFLKNYSDSDVEVPDYINKSGPKGGDYRECEEKLWRIIGEYNKNSERDENISPTLFHCALWGKETGENNVEATKELPLRFKDDGPGEI